MDKFLAIEKILHFHHTTSRQPLRVNEVRMRAFKNGITVSMKDIETIRLIYPKAYRVWNSRGRLMIDALDLPHNADERKTTFHALWQDKENILARAQTNTDSTKVPLNPSDDNDKMTSKCSDKLCTNANTAILPPQRSSHNRILMGRVALGPKNKKLTLIERIREKEAALKCASTPQTVQETHAKFLRSQIPKLKRVLDEIANKPNGSSVEMTHIMDLLRTNLVKLGDTEIKGALDLLIKAHPHFYSVVTVGDTTHIKLRPSVAV